MATLIMTQSRNATDQKPNTMPKGYKSDPKYSQQHISRHSSGKNSQAYKENECSKQKGRGNSCSEQISDKLRFENSQVEAAARRYFENLQNEKHSTLQNRGKQPEKKEKHIRFLDDKSQDNLRYKRNTVADITSSMLPPHILRSLPEERAKEVREFAEKLAMRELYLKQCKEQQRRAMLIRSLSDERPCPGPSHDDPMMDILYAVNTQSKSNSKANSQSDLRSSANSTANSQKTTPTSKRKTMSSTATTPVQSGKSTPQLLQKQTVTCKRMDINTLQTQTRAQKNIVKTNGQNEAQTKKQLQREIQSKQPCNITSETVSQQPDGPKCLADQYKLQVSGAQQAYEEKIKKQIGHIAVIQSQVAQEKLSPVVHEKPITQAVCQDQVVPELSAPKGTNYINEKKLVEKLENHIQGKKPDPKRDMRKSMPLYYNTISSHHQPVIPEYLLKVYYEQLAIARAALAREARNNFAANAPDQFADCTEYGDCSMQQRFQSLPKYASKLEGPQQLNKQTSSTMRQRHHSGDIFHTTQMSKKLVTPTTRCVDDLTLNTAGTATGKKCKSANNTPKKNKSSPLECKLIDFSDEGSTGCNRSRTSSPQVYKEAYIIEPPTTTTVVMVHNTSVDVNHLLDKQLNSNGLVHDYCIPDEEHFDFQQSVLTKEIDKPVPNFAELIHYSDEERSSPIITQENVLILSNSQPVEQIRSTSSVNQRPKKDPKANDQTQVVENPFDPYSYDQNTMRKREPKQQNHVQADNAKSQVASRIEVFETIAEQRKPIRPTSISPQRPTVTVKPLALASRQQKIPEFLQREVDQTLATLTRGSNSPMSPTLPSQPSVNHADGRGKQDKNKCGQKSRKGQPQRGQSSAYTTSTTSCTSCLCGHRPESPMIQSPLTPSTPSGYKNIQISGNYDENKLIKPKPVLPVPKRGSPQSALLAEIQQVVTQRNNTHFLNTTY